MMKISTYTKKVEKKFKNIDQKTPAAISRAINRAATKANKALSAEARKRYLVKDADIKKTISRQKSTRNKLEATIKSEGKGVPLGNYRISPKRPRAKGEEPPKMYKARVLKSSRFKGIYGAFVARMKSGHVGVFKRVKIEPRIRKQRRRFAAKIKKGYTGTFKKINRHNLPIKQLYGPDVPHMIRYETVMNEIEDITRITLKKRINHELKWIIKNS